MVILGGWAFLMSEVLLYLAQTRIWTFSRERGTPVKSFKLQIAPTALGRRQEKDAVQGYLTHKKQPPPQDPTAALCLGTYGDPAGAGVGLLSRYEPGHFTIVTSRGEIM